MFSWLLGNKSILKVNFEDIQILKKNTFLINTLEKYNQSCLIKGTLSIHIEEKTINENIFNTQTNIIIYGKNTNDETIIKKYNQLIKLGFKNVYIYSGGLFEWLCLQDIYGKELFPTIGEEEDILKFKPTSNWI